MSISEMTSMTNSIIRGDTKRKMPDKWLTPGDYNKQQRILYLQSFVKPQFDYCPECLGELDIDEDEVSCKECGLIVSCSSYYVAGQRIDLPYGLR